MPAVDGAIPAELRQLVWIRDRGRCRQCSTEAELHVDHVIPIAFGGGTSEENLQVLCGPCIRRRGAAVS